MKKRVSEPDQLDRILAIMKLLQSHLEAANFDITEFEEVEIFLDLALAAGERHKAPDATSGGKDIVS
ncbi:MAG: hypothetical protein AAF437_01545 [Pseudomonadota bacterium]